MTVQIHLIHFANHFLVLRYISAIHIPLPHLVPALVTANNPHCTWNHFLLFNPELIEEAQIGNKIVKPQANTWIADQRLIIAKST